ncbi:MAG: hypothetical protein KatS3mg090_0547 [Patescibacteria group bacterium]|nr:MAG: hypothetical protein KatS3mg090_0547 [Patescibacteria group bacterium]
MFKRMLEKNKFKYTFRKNFTDTEKKDLIKGLILSILEEFPLLKLSSPSSFYFYTDKDVDIHNCRSIALGCTDFHKYIAVKVDDSSLILELLFHELLHNFLDPEIVVLKRIFNYLDKFEYITFWVSFLDLIDEFLNFLLTVPENIYGLEDYGFSDYKEREESLKIWKLIADKKPRYYKLSFIDGFIRELKVSQNTGFSPEFSQVLFREISLLFHLMHNVYLSDYNNASRSLLLRYKSKGRVVKKFEDIWKRFQSNWLNLSRSEIDIDNFFNDLKY